MQITLDPYIPLALWVPLALAGAALLGWYAVASRRRLARSRWPGVMALMSAAVLLPLVILLNPTWLERIPPPPGKPLLTILVDRSASMATRDAGQGKTRYEAACGLAAEMAGRLEDRYEVRVRTFAADSSPSSPAQLAKLSPDGAVTDLAAGLEEALEEDRPQGQAMLLLSDGSHNAGGGAPRVLESIAKAKAMAAPVYAKTLGGQAGVQDLEVELNLPQELAFVGQQLPVVVNLRQRGTQGRRTGVSLILDGKAIQKRDVDLKPDGTTEAVFQVQPKAPGLYRYEVRADPLPEEVTQVNNTATLLVRVVDQPIRVLLLEGKPYWDTKFLIRTLSEDQSIELVSIVQMAEGRLLERKITRSSRAAGQAKPEKDEKKSGGEGKPDGGLRKPATSGQPPETGVARTDEWTIRKDAAKILSDPESLKPYQIVVLGRSAEVFLSDEALVRLKKWLADGDGSLVCFRGPPASQISQRLGELMPVRWTPSRESRFHVQWTSTGRSLRWLPSSPVSEDLLAGLPSLAVSARAERPAPLAIVLATNSPGKEGQGDPVITYQPVGSGRVVVLEGAGMWRWAFLPPQYQDRDEVYGVLWRSLIRWLVANVGLLPSQQLALRTDQVTFNTAQNASATLLLRPGALGGKVPQIELAGGSLDQPKLVTPEPSGSDPGQFRVPFGRLPEGRYSARVAGAAGDVSSVTAFDVRGNLAERLDVRAQPELMKLVAEKSSGVVLDRDDPSLLAEQFDRHLSQSRPERVARTLAWDRWWILAGVLAVWGTAWGLRRWSGLV